MYALSLSVNADELLLRGDDTRDKPDEAMLQTKDMEFAGV